MGYPEVIVPTRRWEAERQRAVSIIYCTFAKPMSHCRCKKCKLAATLKARYSARCTCWWCGLVAFFIQFVDLAPCPWMHLIRIPPSPAAFLRWRIHLWRILCLRPGRSNSSSSGVTSALTNHCTKSVAGTCPKSLIRTVHLYLFKRSRMLVIQGSKRKFIVLWVRQEERKTASSFATYLIIIIIRPRDRL